MGDYWCALFSCWKRKQNVYICGHTTECLVELTSGMTAWRLLLTGGLLFRSWPCRKEMTNDKCPKWQSLVKFLFQISSPHTCFSDAFDGLSFQRGQRCITEGSSQTSGGVVQACGEKVSRKQAVNCKPTAGALTHSTGARICSSRLFWKGP